LDLLRNASRLLWFLWLVTISDPSGSGMAQEHPVPTATERRGTLWIDGRRRTFLLHLPPLADHAHVLPLVIVLHGHGESAAHVARISGMSTKADQAGFVVVYPNGTGWMNLHPLSWNAGSCCGYAMHRGADDVGFLQALIADLQQHDHTDPKRTYVIGISNGAMLAYRLGCELTEQIAAIAPVAGSLAVPSCTPTAPLSVIAFHGTADASVPYAGGQSPLTRDRRIDPPVATAIAFWAQHDACLPHPQTGEHGDIVREAYVGGAEGTEVVLYTIRGGKHAWPGGKRSWRFGDRPTQEISATDLIWEFFTRHPKP